MLTVGGVPAAVAPGWRRPAPSTARSPLSRCARRAGDLHRWRLHPYRGVRLPRCPLDRQRLGRPGRGGRPRGGRPLALDGNQLWVAGGFTIAGGAPASQLARYSLSARAWSAVGVGGAGGAGLPGTVFALAPAGDRLWASGAFAGSIGGGGTGSPPWVHLVALGLEGNHFALVAAPALGRLPAGGPPRPRGGRSGGSRPALCRCAHHVALWLDAEAGQRRLLQTTGGPPQILWQAAVRPLAGGSTR